MVRVILDTRGNNMAEIISAVITAFIWWKIYKHIKKNVENGEHY